MVRYADDFIITGHSKELLDNEVLPLVAAFLDERGLVLAPGKTRLTRITDGFDFLGQTIRRYQDRVLTKPAKKNVKAFLAKVRAIIKRNPSIDQLSLIQLRNPVIRGWANYHRHAAAKQVFNRAGHEIWRALWRWCRRRHRHKGRRWIKQRYFHHRGHQHWVFMADTGALTDQGQPQWLALCKASHTPIRRHIKIRALANPFDPEWERYFEDRVGLQLASHPRWPRKWFGVWLDQAGLCPVCQQRMTRETGWKAHDLSPPAEGGCATSGNVVLRHPTCHEQVHYLGLTVSKPAPERGLKRPEPYAGKLARTVLRGGGDGNVTASPDLRAMAGGA